MDEIEKYDVALSFAGEQRVYVERVGQELISKEIAIFYDRIEEEIVRLWGGSLTENLHEVYENSSHYVIMFISKEYVEKAWTTHERRSALSGAILGKTKILPVRFDDTPVPGLPTDIAYLQTSDYTPVELARMVAKKLKSDPQPELDIRKHNSLPEFNIHKVDDVSFASVKRLVYRIEVPDMYSEAQGLAIAKHIVDTEHRTKEPVNAAGFFFYFPVANPNGAADGSIDWAPNGKWADALQVQTGDYSNSRLETQFWKERALPNLYYDTRVRMDIFRGIVKAEDRGRVESEKVGKTLEESIDLQMRLTEKYKKELAEAHGLTEEELTKIMVEGVLNNWPMN